MVADTSAVIAILELEPEAAPFAEAIEQDRTRLISPASVLEASVVVLARHGESMIPELDLFPSRAQFEIVPVTVEQVRLGREAFARFGKSRHPARLNLGDCFSYALARVSGEPLLFKGGDFSKTDVKAADFRGRALRSD